MPRIRWPAVLAGVALSVATTLLSTAVLPPIPAAVASVFGLFVSGVLAGKLARTAGAYHGALVGAGYVLCEAVGIVRGLAYSTDPVSDTALVILSDALLIGAAALGGWLARIWSSSDMGKAR